MFLLMCHEHTAQFDCFRQFSIRSQETYNDVSGCLSAREGYKDCPVCAVLLEMRHALCTEFTCTGS